MCRLHAQMRLHCAALRSFATKATRSQQRLARKRARVPPAATRLIEHQFDDHCIKIEMPNVSTEMVKDNDTTGMQVWPSMLRMCEYLSSGEAIQTAKWEVLVPPAEFLPERWPGKNLLYNLNDM